MGGEWVAIGRVVGGNEGKGIGEVRNSRNVKWTGGEREVKGKVEGEGDTKAGIHKASGSPTFQRHVHLLPQSLCSLLVLRKATFHLQNPQFPD